MKNYRPGYHYLPAKNWMNDPNGLIQHKGVYHLYYQCNPYSDWFGTCHWGHATSINLVDWQERPIAMAPDQSTGECHCASGGAAHLPDGSPAFYYTCITEQDSAQWMAFPVDGDMDHLRQTDAYALTVADHPAGMDIREWRAPCVLRHNGRYLMAVGCRLNGFASCLLYTSEDGLHFTYHSVLAQADGGEEVSWECVNFFPMDDKFVLLYSPFREPLYMIGTLTEDLRFIPEGHGVLDVSGHEGCYAPQAFQDEQGRRLLITWLDDRSRGDWREIKGWYGCQSLARELYLEGGILKMRVTPEAEQLVQSTQPLPAPLNRMEAGEQYRVVFEGVIAPDGCVTIDVLSTPDGTEKTCIHLYGNGRMIVDRRYSSTYRTHHSPLEHRVSLPMGQARLEVWVDHSVVEANCNGEWISTRVYPASEQATGLAVHLRGGEGACTLSQLRDCEK